MIVFSSESDAKLIQFAETQNRDARFGLYRYRVSGWPNGAGERTWNSSYRWFFTVRNNWLFVTTTVEAYLRLAEGSVDQMLRDDHAAVCSLALVGPA